MSDTRVKYTGAALPGNAELVVMFDTSLNPVRNFLPMTGASRFRMDINNDQAGTVNAYKSDDDGVTWVQISTLPVVLTAATVTSKIDLPCEGFRDYKVEWLNGATPQTAFDVDMVIVHGDRSPVT